MCICDCLNLQGGLQSTLRKVIPASVARLERIQKLSWQKLQYWMMAIMTAQQVNMVNWGKELDMNYTCSCSQQSTCRIVVYRNMYFHDWEQHKCASITASMLPSGVDNRHIYKRLQNRYVLYILNCTLKSIYPSMHIYCVSKTNYAACVLLLLC